jgi:hypothetical protein
VNDAGALKNVIPDGWYEDPANPAMQRWWAGKQWTEHVRYAPAGSPAPRTPLSAVPQPVPTIDASADAYIPMRGFHFTGQFAGRATPRYSSARRVIVWVLAVALIGITVGAALWFLLPR